MGLWVVSKTKFDVVKLKSVLESRLSKNLIDKVMRKSENGKYLHETLLDDYIAGTITPMEKIKYFPVFKLLDVIRRAFNREEDLFKEELKSVTVRKIFRNALRSIKHFGLETPQTFADPVMIVWNYTNNCNLRCKHCYQNAGVEGNKYKLKELSTEERFKAIDILAERDIPSIFFSGGEPLIEKDFFEVAEHAKKKGFYLSIASNGTLITEDVAKRIKDIGFGYVQVSLDAASAEKHDAFRGVSGMFDRSVQALKNLIKEGIPGCIAYTHMKWNHNEFPRLVELRKQIGAYKIIVYNYIPVGRGGFEMDPTPEQREELFKWMYNEIDAGHHIIATTSPAFGAYCKMNNASSIVLAHYADLKVKELGVIADIIGGCGAGRAYAALQPNGDLTPCVYMPNTILGNIMTEPFDFLWNEHPIMKTLRDREHINCECPYEAVCGGCRARALAYFDDLTAPDPECKYNAHHYYAFMEALKRGEKYVPENLYKERTKTEVA